MSEEETKPKARPQRTRTTERRITTRRRTAKEDNTEKVEKTEKVDKKVITPTPRTVPSEWTPVDTTSSESVTPPAAREDAHPPAKDEIAQEKVASNANSFLHEPPKATPPNAAPTANDPNRERKNDRPFHNHTNEPRRPFHANNGNPNRPDFRRMPRQDRRLSRRERMMLRKQEDPYESAPRSDGPVFRVSELRVLDADMLKKQIVAFGGEDSFNTANRHELIFEVLRLHARRGGSIVTEGVLELSPEGVGFLRNAAYGYRACAEDPCVLPAITRRFNLRAGDTVVGQMRPPRDVKDRYFTLVNVESINGIAISGGTARALSFDQLECAPPKRRISLEMQDDMALRVTDIVAPLGFGQRGLITAAPRTSVDKLIQNAATAIAKHHPTALVFVVVVGGHPEDQAELKKVVKTPVVFSAFDEGAEQQVQMAELVLEQAKREAETGKDVVILLDSATRLVRAYGMFPPHTNKTAAGTVDAQAIQRMRRYLGAARSCDNGGSVTILAVVAAETGNRSDDIIREELSDINNWELVLSKELASKRISPAICIECSGNHFEEELLDTEERARTQRLRRVLGDVSAGDAIDMLVKRLKNTGSNVEFLMSMKENV